jgi:hypothetical protein
VFSHRSYPLGFVSAPKPPLKPLAHESLFQALRLLYSFLKLVCREADLAEKNDLAKYLEADCKIVHGPWLPLQLWQLPNELWVVVRVEVSKVAGEFNLFGSILKDPGRVIFLDKPFEALRR